MLVADELLELDFIEYQHRFDFHEKVILDAVVLQEKFDKGWIKRKGQLNNFVFQKLTFDNKPVVLLQQIGKVV